MHLCIFEDAAVDLLTPLTLTRPAFALWLGAGPLWQRQQRTAPDAQRGAWIRPAQVKLARLHFPDWRINDRAWLDAPVMMLNARWLPPAGVRVDVNTSHIGMIADQIAYIVQPAHAIADFETVDDWVHRCCLAMPVRPAPGTMLDYPWDLIDANADALSADADEFRQQYPSSTPPSHTAVVGPVENFLVNPTATVEPYVVADTRSGPVLIDRGAVVQSFSRLEGPCYIGPHTTVMGAKIRAGTSLGPSCRIGGEMEASIVQGYSNKYHEGFLGHSYLGEWVNLGAATQTSDLRNDYGVVRVAVDDQYVSTGLTKVGSFIGDHTKTGLGVLLNTGTIIGAFCNVLPSGALLPRLVPSFCKLQAGEVTPCEDLEPPLRTAQTVMRRRGLELTEAHREVYGALFEAAGESRHRLPRLDTRRLVMAQR